MNQYKDGFMRTETPFYIIHPYDNLLWIESMLAWDERVAREFAQRLREVILAKYAGRKWAVLHDVRLWQLGTPEMEPIASDLVSTPLTGTITHHALVTGPSEIKKWIARKIFSRVTDYQARMFEDLTDAEVWLLSNGFDKSDRTSS